MKDVRKLQEERNQLFCDVYNSKIPKRVPVNVTLPFEVVAEYGGLDLAETQWNPSLIETAAEKVSQEIYSDVSVYQGGSRLPSRYTLLKSQSFVMGSNGFMQHPEVEGMLSEDYDDLIKKPYDCLIERVIPRQYKAMDLSDPGVAMLSFAKAAFASMGDMDTCGQILARIQEKYGFSTFGMWSAQDGFTAAPCDFLADQLRGFKGISMDIRRNPQKVAEACEALYPIVKNAGFPMATGEYSYVNFPLHMPTFMREAYFAKYWWSAFKKLCDDYASMGIRVGLFCEDNWMRYLDYLQELPVNSVLQFEYGDAKEIKRRIGNRHIISGLYPITYLKHHSKQECIDLAKQLIDDLAPGGKYIFAFDKEPLSIHDTNFENMCAVAETVRDYGVYSNPGEQVGDIFRKEDYTAAPSRSIESKYYKDWFQNDSAVPGFAAYAAPKFQGLEEMIFATVVFLLI